MVNYKKRLLAHLGEYKRSKLGIEQNGIYRKTGQPYEHILPIELNRLNIIETIRREFWAFYRERCSDIPLHGGFHHLNSSQAFTFNTFFPWLALGKSPLPLLEALGLPKEQIAEWAFEDVPCPNEETNVDIRLTFQGGMRALIEMKLTEDSFGKCEPDEAHRVKLETIYGPILRDRAGPESLKDAVFFANYQLFRYIHLLQNEDVLVLLLPRANALAWRHATRFCREHLTPGWVSRVKIVAFEDVLSRLRQQSQALDPLLAVHTEMLAEKYLLPEIAGGKGVAKVQET